MYYIPRADNESCYVCMCKLEVDLYLLPKRGTMSHIYALFAVFGEYAEDKVRVPVCAFDSRDAAEAHIEKEEKRICYMLGIRAAVDALVQVWVESHPRPQYPEGATFDSEEYRTYCNVQDALTSAQKSYTDNLCKLLGYSDECMPHWHDDTYTFEVIAIPNTLSVAA